MNRNHFIFLMKTHTHKRKTLENTADFWHRQPAYIGHSKCTKSFFSCFFSITDFYKLDDLRLK